MLIVGENVQLIKPGPVFKSEINDIGQGRICMQEITGQAAQGVHDEILMGKPVVTEGIPQFHPGHDAEGRQGPVKGPVFFEISPGFIGMGHDPGQEVAKIEKAAAWGNINFCSFEKPSSRAETESGCIRKAHKRPPTMNRYHTGDADTRYLVMIPRPFAIFCQA